MNIIIVFIQIKKTFVSYTYYYGFIGIKKERYSLHQLPYYLLTNFIWNTYMKETRLSSNVIKNSYNNLNTLINLSFYNLFKEHKGWYVWYVWLWLIYFAIIITRFQNIETTWLRNFVSVFLSHRYVDKYCIQFCVYNVMELFYHI